MHVKQLLYRNVWLYMNLLLRHLIYSTGYCMHLDVDKDVKYAGNIKRHRKA